MIPNSTLDIETLESNIEGETIDMSLDESALAHIMSVLTDLYSDTAGAVIREYSTNGADSHIDAGKGHVPIEVSKPNAFAPFFKVRDFGTGMSLKDIRDTYSKYGSSTKRDSNDFNGTLGLGSKSALTYTSAFTVVSIKDGIKNVVVVGRRDNGVGYMDVVDTSDSTEPTGVEIQIPVPTREHATFSAKVDNFFKYWAPGTVLVDQKEPLLINRSKWIAMSDNGKTWLEKLDYTSSERQDTIVMGGVAYPSPFEPGFSGYRFIHFADMGDVVFSPSRESLRTNNQNRNVRDAVIAHIKENFIEHVSKTVRDADDIKSAISAAVVAERAIVDVVYDGSHYTAQKANKHTKWTFEYNGQPLSVFRNKVGNWIHNKVTVTEGNASVFSFHVSHHGSRFGRIDCMGSIGYAENLYNKVEGGAKFVTGLTYDVMNSNSRNTIIRGLRYLGYVGETFIAGNDMDKGTKALFGDDVVFVSVKDIREAARESLKESRGTGPVKPRPSKAKSEADVITGMGEDTILTDIQAIDPLGKDVIFTTRGIVRERNSIVHGTNMYERCKSLGNLVSTFSDYTFVVVVPSGEEAFRKRFPLAQSLTEIKVSFSTDKFVDMVIKKAGGGITKADVAALADQNEGLDRSWRDSTSEMDSIRQLRGYSSHEKVVEFLKVDDRMILVAKAYKESIQSVRGMFDLSAFNDYNKDVAFESTPLKMAKGIVTEYPLLAAAGHNLRHADIYMNAVDAAKSN